MARSINKNLKSSISIEVSSFNPAQRKPVEPKLEYKDQYLTFEALENCIFTLTIPAEINQDYMTSISYSTNNGKTWVTTEINNIEQIITTPVINKGKTVLWKGTGLVLNINYYDDYDDPHKSSIFSSSGKFNIYGNIMSLLYGDDFKNKKSFPENTDSNFSRLFYNTEKLINAKNLTLSANTLVLQCYISMFENCTQLKTAPKLPATTLANGCYAGMFKGCSSLSVAPELPATILTGGCYSEMFYGCISLINTPKLPATTLANNCYAEMFYKCTQLKTATILPATILQNRCYESMFSKCTSLITAPQILGSYAAYFSCYYMFEGCTSLITAPQLPATELGDFCYHSMFKNCTSLINAPELPALTLGKICYESMFEGCTSLKTAPELPATTLSPACYQSMFKNCTSLINAPSILPAQILTEACYNEMFRGCTSLKTAPILPARGLVRICYQYMFRGCSSLNYIKAMFITSPNDNTYKYTEKWVQEVSINGTFIKNSEASWNIRGDNGIPQGWTVETVSE